MLLQALINGPKRIAPLGLIDLSCAPLAQSAERFHGKEKVDGSIPSGGSVILCAPSRDVRHRPLAVRIKVAMMAV